MLTKKSKERLFFEIALIVICAALCCLLYRVGSYRMVVLNLFYLPVVLAAFFLGRYLAGVLALLSVIGAAMVMVFFSDTLAAYTSPVAVALALAMWAAVMGVNAILVGTLSDERAAKIGELHDAYLGVLDVLVQYLNSADPRRCDQARQVAELSQQVAGRMKFTGEEIDDIRVAALLQNIDNIEVTARVIRKAVGEVAQGKRAKHLEHTFHGRDLVQSLGTVLAGALPLLAPGEEGFASTATETPQSNSTSALGKEVIRTARAYLNLITRDASITNSADALAALRSGAAGEQNAVVLRALEQAVAQTPEPKPELQTCGA